jgi:hypothetical protein
MFKNTLKSTFAVACASLLLSTSAFAADCTKMADEKKLAGAAKDSHIKKCVADAAGGKK